MTRGPILGLVDVSKPFKIETNAFDFSLGGIFIQEGNPIAYESQKLNDVDRRYIVSKKKKKKFVVVHALESLDNIFWDSTLW